MIKNGHFYPDWQWKKKLHKNEETGEYEGDCAFCILEGNRIGGKSVGVAIYALWDFFKYGYRCCFTTRYKDDIEDSKTLPLESFWKKGWDFINSDVVRVPDIEAHELTFKGHHAFIDGKLFCYPTALSTAGKGKRGHYENVHTIIMDEYIAEGERELDDEMAAVYRLYDTVARGRDDALETTSMIFISNCVSEASSVKDELGISKEIRNDTKRVDRGKTKGWCYERMFNKAVSDNYKNSAISRAQMCGDIGQMYQGYAQNNKWQDNNSFVQKKKPTGKCESLFNIRHLGKLYGIMFYAKEEKYYMTDEGVDETNPLSFAMSTDDHVNDTLMRDKFAKIHLQQLKLRFNRGDLIFANMNCKKAFMDFYKYL